MKRQLTESDICMKYIDPALKEAGWDIQKQVFREAKLNQLTPGRSACKRGFFQERKA